MITFVHFKMKTDKEIIISAISYLNTKPFIYGIENAGLLKNYKLELDYQYHK